jgi:hypothetical protein
LGILAEGNIPLFLVILAWRLLLLLIIFDIIAQSKELLTTLTLREMEDATGKAICNG